MAQKKRGGYGHGSGDRDDIIRSGGVEYRRSKKGDRLDSSTVKRPNLPRVTSDDYADYVSNYSGRIEGAKRKTQRRVTRPDSKMRETAVEPSRNGPEIKGFESALVGSPMRMVLKKYIPKKWLRISVSVAAGFLSALMVYQIFMSFYVQFKTEAVISSPYYETIDTEGVTIRDEIVLSGELSDTSVIAVKNGDKISMGQPLINIFSSQSEAAAYKRISEIDQQVESLENMVTASEDNANTVENIGKSLDQRMINLSESSVNRKMSDISEMKSDICYLLNKRMVAMRKMEVFTDRIDQLKAEKAAIEEKYTTDHDSVLSEYSGYYYETSDGYENMLNSSIVSGLTVSELEDIMKEKPSVPSKSIGKIVNTFEWYLACPVPNEEAEKSLNVGSVYTLQLPYSKNGSVRATLSKLNYDSENDNYLAVFSCSVFSSEIFGVRTQPVRIEKCRYEGYVIKKSALHAGVKDVVHRNDFDETEEMPRGHLVYVTQTTYPSVYAVVGGQINEKEVRILYGTDKMVICSPNHDRGDYLSLYDTVVIEERGLYDGKLVR